MILYVWKLNNAGTRYTRTAVIDNATSVIWVKRFNSAGEFELYVRASTEMFDLFGGNETVLTREGDSGFAMCVENIKLTTDAENGDYLTITGRSIESIIGRRIVNRQSNFNDTAENAIRSLISQNITNPSSSYRKIDMVMLETAHGWDDAINKQVTGKNLLDVISDICITYDYGFRLYFGGGTVLVFQLYKGTDRSFDQSTNPYVIFSPEYENLGNTEYTNDKTTYYNAVYVAGEGEGTARKIVYMFAGRTSPRGLAMREKWVDARNTSSNDGEISAGEYQQLLYAQASEELSLAKETTTFSGETLDYNVFQYGVDYELGDKVSIVNEYGITGTATVTEITIVEDENGYRMYPTLSEWSV